MTIPTDETMRRYLSQFNYAEMVDKYIALNREIQPYKKVHSQMAAVNDVLNRSVPWNQYPGDDLADALKNLKKLHVLMSHIDKDPELRGMFDTMLLYMAMTE